MDLATLTIKAREYLALVEATEPVVHTAAEAVVEGFRALSKAEAEDITELLTGNARADRARMETAAAANIVNSSIDWANLPAEAFKLAKIGVELALLFI